MFKVQSSKFNVCAHSKCKNTYFANENIISSAIFC